MVERNQTITADDETDTYGDDAYSNPDFPLALTLTLSAYEKHAEHFLNITRIVHE